MIVQSIKRGVLKMAQTIEEKKLHSNVEIAITATNDLTLKVTGGPSEREGSMVALNGLMEAQLGLVFRQLGYLNLNGFDRKRYMVAYAGKMKELMEKNNRFATIVERAKADEEVSFAEFLPGHSEASIRFENEIDFGYHRLYIRYEELERVEELVDFVFLTLCYTTVFDYQPTGEDINAFLLNMMLLEFGGLDKYEKREEDFNLYVKGWIDGFYH